MKIVKFVQFNHDNPNYEIDEISSPVCQKCGTKIDYRFQLSDGLWYGSECVENELGSLAKKIAKSCKRVKSEMKPHFGKKVSAKIGGRWNYGLTLRGACAMMDCGGLYGIFNIRGRGKIYVQRKNIRLPKVK